MLVGAVVVAAVTVAGCAGEPEGTSQEPTSIESTGTSQEATPAQSQDASQEASGLKIKDLVVGKGAEAETGDRVTVHYTGWLADGKKFDSSLDRKKPFQFDLGQARVIPGWDEGLVGMKVGGKRRLTIPPEMAYGAQGAGGVIPPNAVLTFEVSLLAVKPGSP